MSEASGSGRAQHALKKRLEYSLVSQCQCVALKVPALIEIRGALNHQGAFARSLFVAVRRLDTYLCVYSLVLSLDKRALKEKALVRIRLLAIGMHAPAGPSMP